jgi:hypothetical protein
MKNEKDESFEESTLQPSLITKTFDLRCTVENLDAEAAQIENMKKVRELK